MQFLALDLETSGVDCRRHGMLDVGAVWIRPQGVADVTFTREARVCEEDAVDEEALAVNGWKLSEVRSGRRAPWPVVVAELLGWIEGTRLRKDEAVMLVGWNVQFDLGVLREGVRRLAMPDSSVRLSARVLDLHSVVLGRRLLRDGVAETEKVGKMNSDDGSRFLGLEPEAKPHKALAGALHARLMFDALGFDRLPAVRPNPIQQPARDTRV